MNYYKYNIRPGMFRTFLSSSLKCCCGSCNSPIYYFFSTKFPDGWSVCECWPSVIGKTAKSGPNPLHGLFYLNIT